MIGEVKINKKDDIRTKIIWEKFNLHSSYLGNRVSVW